MGGGQEPAAQLTPLSVSDKASEEDGDVEFMDNGRHCGVVAAETHHI